jgi:hypothetical protein
MNAVKLRIENFFDKRNVKTILDTLRSDEVSEAFDPTRTAIYRIDLPDRIDIAITTDEGEAYRFRRSLMELLQLGDRVYVADALPMALFPKQLALFVFSRFSQKPKVVVRAQSHIWLNDDPVPLFDPGILHEQAVHNRQAIPPPDVLGPLPSGIQATSIGPLSELDDFPDDDQLVIHIAAHGGGGNVAFQPEKGVKEDIAVTRIYQQLAGIPKIAAHPEKVVLIIQSCQSGQFFDSNKPGVLQGMGLITSSPDDRNSYGGEFARWLKKILERNDVVTWQDLVAALKWCAVNDPSRCGPVPRNGSIGGCRIRAVVESTEYRGENIGNEWFYSVNVNDSGKVEVDWHTVPFNGSAQENQLVYDYLVRCISEEVRLGFSIESKLRGPSGHGDNIAWAEYRLTCDHTATYPFHKRGGVSINQRIAYLDFNFSIHTECV